MKISLPSQEYKEASLSIYIAYNGADNDDESGIKVRKSTRIFLTK